MPRIQAAVCHRFGDPLVLEPLDLRAPLAGEVEVTLEAVAICHSDIHFAEGAWGGTLPMVFGHEAAGRVTALGPGTEGIALGSRVAVTLVQACGQCPTCATGRPVHCHSAPARPAKLTRPDTGAEVIAAMNCGAFAEKVVVDRSQIAPLPDSLPAEAVALLACGVITGVGAVVHSGALRAGEDVVVIGAGGVGLNAIQGARIAGARRIVAVDLSPEKLEDAKRFGATHGVLASHDTPWSEAKAALGGKGADLAIVTVGAIPAFEAAPRYLGHDGRLVAVGLPPSGALAQWEPAMTGFMGQRVIGSKMGDVVISRDIPWLADLYLQGRLMLDDLVSGRWRFDQINAAIDDTRGGKARRNVILF